MNNKERAREIWELIERSRGVYHPNDKDAYLAAYEAALDEKDIQKEQAIRGDRIVNQPNMKVLEITVRRYAREYINVPRAEIEKVIGLVRECALIRESEPDLTFDRHKTNADSAIMVIEGWLK